jgi:hypothetical protein
MAKPAVSEPAATEPKKSLRNDFINVYEHVKTSSALIEIKNGGLCDLAAGCAQHGRGEDLRAGAYEPSGLSPSDPLHASLNPIPRHDPSLSDARAPDCFTPLDPSSCALNSCYRCLLCSKNSKVIIWQSTVHFELECSAKRCASMSLQHLTGALFCACLLTLAIWTFARRWPSRTLGGPIQCLCLRLLRHR